ncbi:YbaB/EbfC DNA-binding family protein [Nonomuraea polychroma]|uniref:YbaB/EbfC DNA-binding family protein n=1 Tax=Nonomuraea polychroma TaxID=46176 RepID=A0A438MPH5_9ACTN|nr:YbaB/EbfC family nucleoid-associated protein [Nonomuraea polychroma]RVX47345.1 YbaB/EbfC DNA-binding family protein [Nonomuraea polychroma]
MNSSHFHPDDLDRVLQESESSIRALAGALHELGAVTGEGESLSGVVRARVDANGWLDDLRLSARASRMELDELTAEIVQAVRAAQDDQARKALELMPQQSFPGMSFDEVSRQFQELQDDFSRQMSERLDGLETIRRRVDSGDH